MLGVGFLMEGENKMKVSELRDLENHEVAVAIEPSGEVFALANHNVQTGLCDCCRNYSLATAEILLIRNARTGEVVWEAE
jgi:hypothetical protein